MTNVQILSGGLTGASMVENGLQYYEWGFTVNVDGQVYWTGVWVSGPNANNPDSLGKVEAEVIDLLESDDPGQGLDGIAQDDGTGVDDGTVVVVGDDDSDDSAVASLDGGDYGDSA